MRNTLFAFLTIFFLFALSTKAQESKDLTIMSYNIKIGTGMDKNLDLSRTAKVINHVAPDILGLQEVDSMTHRSMLHQAKELGKLTGMHETFAPAIPLGEKGKYGIALLSKEKPLNVTRISLPGTEERRVAVIVEFADYVFVNTHFSLTEKDRVSSVDLIVKEVQKFTNKPVFLSGDLNAKPDSEAISKFKEHFTILSDTNIMTYPSDKPKICIDYIMLYNNEAKDRVVKNFSYVYDEPLISDHRPLVVGIRIMQ